MVAEKDKTHMAQAVEILLVEDDEGDALLTSEALAESTFENNLNVVCDGVEALSFLQKEAEYENAPRPDIILLDLNMPRMNGHEVLRWLKESAEFRSIPVVIFTTSDSVKDIRSTYENHANCFITKPLCLDMFAGALKRIQDFWMGAAKLPPA